MIQNHARSRRGLTLVELMLALSITVMVAGALAAMVDAVVVGTTTRSDARSTLVQGSSIATRLASYVTPSRCVLAADPDGFVLWLEDSRKSDTVHATEIRWFDWDADTGTVWVSWVFFPDEWKQAACDLADTELPKQSDWDAVYVTFDTAGHIASMPIAEALNDFTVDVPSGTVQEARRIGFDVRLAARNGSVALAPICTMELHEEPHS